MRFPALILCVLALALRVLPAGAADASTSPAALPSIAEASPAALPSFAELEAAGARIGEIRVDTENIFDTADPKENKLLFRWANRLHVRTHPDVIRRALLFKSGEPLSARLIEETERVLNGKRYLYEVTIRPVAWHDGVVDIEVKTRDTWTLDIGASAGRSGGANTSGLSISEYNVLGTGVSMGYGRSNELDRSSNEFLISNDRAFDGWTTLSFSTAQNSDGRRDSASVMRPFNALDARWAAGATALRDDRIDSVYEAGDVVSQYRHRQRRAEVFGGWSAGLVDGWARRWSVGLTLLEDSYRFETGRIAPARLPRDEKLVAPFVRYELLEDHYQRLQNRDLIAQPEFFALGTTSTVQLGWASTALGSSHDALLYSGTLSRGYEPAPQHTLITSASIAGEFTEGHVWRQQVGAQVRYYRPQGKRSLFYATASADMLTHPDVLDMLLLGGDNGLRGYPLRYQSGTRRALFTAEERVYSDWYVWQLFRVGAAAFADVGRAWGGDHVNTVDPGWLGDVGIGLRIVSARAAFSNVLHVDLAFPLNAQGDVKKVQLLVKTKASF